MPKENHQALAQAEIIAREAKRCETERLVKECERSDNRTLRSLADLYRRLDFGY
jgi:hypothetical protein